MGASPVPAVSLATEEVAEGELTACDAKDRCGRSSKVNRVESLNVGESQDTTEWLRDGRRQSTDHQDGGPDSGSPSASPSGIDVDRVSPGGSHPISTVVEQEADASGDSKAEDEHVTQPLPHASDTATSHDDTAEVLDHIGVCFLA